MDKTRLKWSNGTTGWRRSFIPLTMILMNTMTMSIWATSLRWQKTLIIKQNKSNLASTVVIGRLLIYLIHRSFRFMLKARASSQKAQLFQTSISSYSTIRAFWQPVKDIREIIILFIKSSSERFLMIMKARTSCKSHSTRSYFKTHTE